LLHAGVHGRTALLLWEHSLLGRRLHAWCPMLCSQLLPATIQTQLKAYLHSELAMLTKV
jgi:hypothetical protein